MTLKRSIKLARNYCSLNYFVMELEDLLWIDFPLIWTVAFNTFMLEIPAEIFFLQTWNLWWVYHRVLSLVLFFLYYILTTFAIIFPLSIFVNIPKTQLLLFLVLTMANSHTQHSGEWSLTMFEWCSNNGSVLNKSKTPMVAISSTRYLIGRLLLERLKSLCLWYVKVIFV